MALGGTGSTVSHRPLGFPERLTRAARAPRGRAGGGLTGCRASCSWALGSQRTPAQPISRAGSLIFKELPRTFQELRDMIFCDACAVWTSVFYT